MRSGNGAKFRFGEFELDPARRSLTRNGELLALNSKTFDLLCLLVERHGNVVTKDELLSSVWPDQFVEENNLTVQVSALRKALGGNQIATITGKGYSFVAEVEQDQIDDEIIIENRTIERITIDNQFESGENIHQLTGKWSARRPPIVIMGLLIIALSGFAAFKYFTKTPATKINSIAVLPFVNQTADENNEYLSDGLAESAIYSLSRLPDIRVMSRNSAFRYKGKEADAKLIGSELNVQAILTGRVTRRGDELTINAELTSTADNSVIWGEQFTRKMSDAASLESDIARSISGRLMIKLNADKDASTVNSEAYQLYLQGLFLLNKRTPPTIEKSIELFQQAVEKDPNYAQAFATLAFTYSALESHSVMNKQQFAANLEKQRQSAASALAIDKSNGLARSVIARIKEHEWDFAGAEREYKQVQETDPNAPFAYIGYSELLSKLGRVDEGLNAMKKAYDLDPLSPATIMNLGLRYYDTRQFDEAIKRCRSLTETEPDYPWAYIYLAAIYEEQGRLAEAIDPFLKGRVNLKSETPERAAIEAEKLRTALAKGGADGYWRESLRYELEAYDKGGSYAFAVAVRYARLRQYDKTFEWLEKEFAGGSRSEITFIKHEPAFKEIERDPRILDLLRRVGLPE